MITNQQDLTEAFRSLEGPGEKIGHDKTPAND
jgi:hypothetical protein